MKKLISLITRIFPRQMLIRFSYLFSLLIRPFYWGNKVECPICGGHFRKFLPYGYGEAMDNRLCPKCLSLERHRLLWLYLKEKTGFFTDNLKVLHFAPEQPFLKRFRALKNLDYTTADIDSPIADLNLDVTEMNIPDNQYDVLICNHVLEHVDNVDKAFSEIKRVLKPGGWAILMVPINPDVDTFEDPSVTDPEERKRLFGQYDHVRQFGRDYADVLSKAGFKVTADRLYYELPDEKREKMHLARKGEELVYVAKV
ncbi:MAG TPA: methyltransferase domain-containing protein [Bacteroidetes bacterium]|nr:methyltransferase domain-containing protein [Candidatus Limimorpha avicola]